MEYYKISYDTQMSRYSTRQFLHMNTEKAILVYL